MAVFEGEKRRGEGVPEKKGDDKRGRERGEWL